MFETPMHVRAPLPRRGGNSFYRDKRVFETRTLCGAPVTDRDVDHRYAGTKKFNAWRAKYPATVCDACMQARLGGAQ